MKHAMGRSAALALGVVWTVGFYLIVALPFFEGGTLERYTAHHVTEYVTVALFFWGMADLLVRRVALAPQWRAVRTVSLNLEDRRIRPEKAIDLRKRFEGLSAVVANTIFVRRLANALDYVSQRGTGSELEKHLQYLGDVDRERSHAGYAFVRFIAWVIPILGFLGTVIHFTMAISQVTPEQLEHSLSAVTGALGVAFDTTALALSLSIVLMFFIFVVERSEKNLLHEVEMAANRELSHRFDAADATVGPYLSALTAFGEATIQKMESLVRKQAEVWTESLEAVRMRDEQTMKKLLDAVSLTVAQTLEGAAQFQARQDERLGRLLNAVESERAAAAQDRERQSSALVHAAEKLDAAQQRMAVLAETLQQILQAERPLLDLQVKLADNLELLTQTQRIDEAVNSLTAAIHLMTARRLAGAERRLAA